MKRFLSAGLLCMSLFTTIQAQTTHTVKHMETQLQDVLNVLEDMDIHIHRFDVSQFLDATYQMEIYVDEYKNHQKTGRTHHFDLGKNICSLDEIPEEHKEGFRKAYKIPNGEKEWDNIKEISIYIRQDEKNDSTAEIRISCPNVGTQGFRFTLYPADGRDFYSYHTRPFAFHAIQTADEMKIPLLLYGSAWAEPGTTFFRFCGENEIDPEMKAEILRHTPHYYIIGIRLNKKR